MRHFSGEFSGVRLLMEDELLMIAGGDGEDTDDVAPPEVDEIVVNGVPLPPQYYWLPPQLPAGSGGFDPTGTGAGPEDDYPDAPDTPCVETSFANGVSVDRVNNAAMSAAQAFNATGQQANWEYGAFIYEYGGQVLYTPPFTNQSYDHVDFSTAALPDGAHVLAIIHNHPYQAGDVDQRSPSSADWSIYNQLAGQTVGSKTFDANMLNYISTNQDGLTRPYDNTDKNDSSPTCGF
jgi:hypothetical protein